jgi:hypothetical protein
MAVSHLTLLGRRAGRSMRSTESCCGLPVVTAPTSGGVAPLSPDDSGAGCRSLTTSSRAGMRWTAGRMIESGPLFQAVNCRAHFTGLRLARGFLAPDLRVFFGLLTAGLIGGSLGCIS